MTIRDLAKGHYLHGVPVFADRRPNDRGWLWCPPVTSGHWSHAHSGLFWACVQRSSSVVLEGCHSAILGALCRTGTWHVVYDLQRVQACLEEDHAAPTTAAEKAARNRNDTVMATLFSSRFDRPSPVFAIGT